jgi:hypothetical protein
VLPFLYSIVNVCAVLSLRFVCLFCSFFVCLFVVFFEMSSSGEHGQDPSGLPGLGSTKI